MDTVHQNRGLVLFRTIDLSWIVDVDVDDFNKQKLNPKV